MSRGANEWTLGFGIGLIWNVLGVSSPWWVLPPSWRCIPSPIRSCRESLTLEIGAGVGSIPYFTEHKPALPALLRPHRRRGMR